jgi:hypothetical protein
MITVTILKPKDVLVLNFGDKTVSEPAKEKYRVMLQLAGIPNKVVFLDSGIKLEILTKE